MVDLTDKIFRDDIVQFIKDNQSITSDEQEIFDIMEKNIKPMIEERLGKEIISDRAYQISCQRIPPINIFKLVQKRLSKIYVDPPTRTADDDNKTDQKLIHLYEKKARLNSIMNTANLMTNAQRRCCLEPYLYRGIPKIRIIPANEFIVYSEDEIDKTYPEVIIKFVGDTPKVRINYDGTETTEMIPLYHFYTENQFAEVDGDGDLHGGVIDHNLGIMPLVYINDSKFELLPEPKTDDVEFFVLMIKLLTDLNYAVKYQAHSMIYMINVDTEKIDMNPDAILDLKSEDSEEQAEVGSIKPQIEIISVLESIASQLKLYLESKGLKADINATIRSDKAMSGIHETIKNATLIEERKDQIDLFKTVEEDQLWELISIRHNGWKLQNKLNDKFKKYSFSKDFEMTIAFEEQKLTMSRRDKGLMISTELDANLISHDKAVTEMNPNLSEGLLKVEKEKIKKDIEDGTKIVDSQIKMNPHNKKLAEEKVNRSASNAKSTEQDVNPNKS